MSRILSAPTVSRKVPVQPDTGSTVALARPAFESGTDAADSTGQFLLAANPEGVFEAFAEATIMLVDDEPLNNEIAQALLEKAGYQNFVTTTQSKDAIGLILQRRPDVLLLDLMMPEVSGFDILNVIRRHQELRYMPVIILTAASDASTKLRALELGATEILTKPVDGSELRLRLRNALALKAYRDRSANYDALTDLPNRRKFISDLHTILQSARDAAQTCALLHLNLDRFSQINDTLGHEVGDRLLRGTAQRLERALPDCEDIATVVVGTSGAAAMLARTGGDEFCALLVNLRSPEEAEDTAGKVLKEFSRPFNLAGHDLVVTPSIGVAVFPRDGETPDVLLRHAERAMCKAKDQGRGGYEVFDDRAQPDALEHLKLSGHLRRALDREEFLVYFQPKVDIEARRVVGVEALVRWSHPELGMIGPEKFIPVAEKQGLIVELGAWVLKAACREVQRWRQQGLPLMQLSVNVSVLQLAQRKIIDAVRSALQDSGLPPDHLVLELTESVLLRNVENSTAVLRDLGAMGVKLSIDDFGTGYSSLSYLTRFRLHEIKIDRSFMKTVPTDTDNSAIVSAIIALARELRLRVVAEGVETDEQLRFLMQRRCTEFQGDLCSRPLPGEEFVEFIRKVATKAA